MVFAPVKAEGSEGDPVYRWIELLERQRIIRERGRLLYVAATRAKHSLHLLGTVQARDRGGELTLREPVKGSMLRMLWHAVASHFDAEAPSASSSAPSLVAPVQELHRIPLDWVPPAVEKPLHVAAAPVVDLEAERPIFDWVSETSRHVGTLVHRELERLCASRDAAPASRARLLLELAELGVPPDRCAGACDRVIAAVGHTMNDKRGRWVLGLDGGIQDAASELALSGVLAGKIVEGIIDRTFLDEQGTRWVIDFKTSTHEGGGRSAFLDEEVARYRQQLLRYASLMRLYRPRQHVRAALYFPLMREWREVPLDEKRQLDWLS